MESEKAIIISSTDPIYTLSVASKISKIPGHSIRQYVGKGLIIPFTTPTGRHLFSEVDINRLTCISKYLNEYGLNIAGIKAIFSLIPCWAIKKCSESERRNCGAYTNSMEPCWSAANKSFVCLNTDCRECAVYQLPHSCKDLKTLYRELVK